MMQLKETSSLSVEEKAYLSLWSSISERSLLLAGQT